ncbi:MULTISPECIES: histidine kinase dimerization/phospho-acceptor domain-containing protein [Mesorhizobium]|uniref:histidine kinase dimerization/phospho-acceptor domain-containing protein n=1 Tax=Mesorhizobium TaxID=68287 RepID=UPI0007A941CC|nr:MULTISPECIES: histidine kinase dimerization/phospho-acceptor domain-containing protein [Mesorhizobium]AMX97794.1 hypothetical protein A4R28_31870 [Mesorhizobium ciceri]MDF3233937.1 histidine kinase dimerization/phospho-acceptor domain-containing protein [Mesorhizobium sp. DSM 30133]
MKGELSAKAGVYAKTALRSGPTWSSTPIRHEDGELLGFAKITRDITERKKAQEKMDAIGKLTGGVAHDFNNLLMAILGSLELLRKRLPDDPQLLRLLDNAVLGARRGASLTQRMLAFAWRQQLDPKPVDLIGLNPGNERIAGAVAWLKGDHRNEISALARSCNDR